MKLYAKYGLAFFACLLLGFAGTKLLKPDDSQETTQNSSEVLAEINPSQDVIEKDTSSGYMEVDNNITTEQDRTEENSSGGQREDKSNKIGNDKNNIDGRDEKKINSSGGQREDKPNEDAFTRDIVNDDNETKDEKTDQLQLSPQIVSTPTNTLSASEFESLLRNGSSVLSQGSDKVSSTVVITVTNLREGENRVSRYYDITHKLLTGTWKGFRVKKVQTDGSGKIVGATVEAVYD